MSENRDTYLGVNLERWKNDMVTHLRDERRRNVLLQKRLDDSQAEIARLQAQLLDAKPAPMSKTQQLFTKSRAIRRMLASSMAS